MGILILILIICMPPASTGMFLGAVIQLARDQRLLSLVVMGRGVPLLSATMKSSTETVKFSVLAESLRSFKVAVSVCPGSPRSSSLGGMAVIIV